MLSHSYGINESYLTKTTSALAYKELLMFAECFIHNVGSEIGGS